MQHRILLSILFSSKLEGFVCLLPSAGARWIHTYSVGEYNVFYTGRSTSSVVVFCFSILYNYNYDITIILTTHRLIVFWIWLIRCMVGLYTTVARYHLTWLFSWVFSERRDILPSPLRSPFSRAWKAARSPLSAHRLYVCCHRPAPADCKHWTHSGLHELADNIHT